MNLSKLRRLSDESRNEAEKRRAEEACKELLRKEESADQAIANLAQLVAERAGMGQNNAVVFLVFDKEFTREPRKNFFVNGYSTAGLPKYARRVYEHCEAQGFKTSLVECGGGPSKFNIEVVW